jgi:hypothetical protein
MYIDVFISVIIFHLILRYGKLTFYFVFYKISEHKNIEDLENLVEIDDLGIIVGNRGKCCVSI